MMKFSDHNGWSIGVRLGWHGVAVLFYRPERRLSVSIWARRWSKNIRVLGPAKLSWER